jgi:hypothetical protein
MDETKILFNDVLKIDQRKMTALANAAKQPVTIEFNEEGEVKEMSDGTKYRVTPNGWVKI